MTVIQKRLIQAYATLVMAERKKLEDVLNDPVTLDSGETSTMQKEIEVEMANRIVATLETT